MLANLWLTSRLLQTTHDRTGESRTGGMCWLRISWSYGHWFSSVDQLCVGLIPHGTPNRFLSARIERERTHYAFIKYLKVLFQNNFDESVHTFDSTLQNQGFDDITTMKTWEPELWFPLRQLTRRGRRGGRVYEPASSFSAGRNTSSGQQLWVWPQLSSLLKKHALSLHQLGTPTNFPTFQNKDIPYH